MGCLLTRCVVQFVFLTRCVKSDEASEALAMFRELSAKFHERITQETSLSRQNHSASGVPVPGMGPAGEGAVVGAGGGAPAARSPGDAYTVPPPSALHPPSTLHPGRLAYLSSKS